jgi:outer membrane protein assembly factor BamB
MHGRTRPALALAALLGMAGGMTGGPAQADLQARPAAQVAAQADSGDWPMDGQNLQRTGYNAAETTLSAANVAALTPRWQVALPGDGQSSSNPIVAQGRVYVASSADNGDNYFAFDAQTGGVLWSADLGHMADCFGVGIGSTAAVSGTLLAVGGGDAAYYGLDAQTGAIRWRAPMSVGPSGFAWASPLLANGRAYVGIASDCDNPSVRGEIRAVDGQTGALLAARAFVPGGQAGAGIWHSAALSPDGATLAVATGEDFGGYNGPYNRAMVALDPLTLAVRASYQSGSTGGDQDYATSPVIFRDSLHRTLVAGNHKDNRFYTFDLANIAAGPVWERPLSFMAGMTPAYDPNTGPGGTLFAADADGAIYALDPATGAVRWTRAATSVVHGGFALANGLLFANEGGGALLILDAATGAVLRTIVPARAGGALSGVTVAGGRVYWVSGRYLNAWGLPPPDPTPGPGCAFTDVCADDYYYTPVAYAVSSDIVSGYADGSFRPFAGATRGQLVKMVTVAFDLPAHTPATPTFADVPRAAPFYPYIEAAVHAGAVAGYADGTFRPNAGVTRAQLTKIIVDAAGWLPVTPAEPSFADVPAASPYFTAIETAACHGLVSGYSCGATGEECDGQERPYFRVGAPATRAQIAKTLYGALTNAPACGD